MFEETFLPGMENLKEPESQPELKSVIRSDNSNTVSRIPEGFRRRNQDQLGYRDDCPECQNMGMVGCSRHRRKAA